MPTLDEVGGRITWGDEPRRVEQVGTYHPGNGRSESTIYVTMADRPDSDDADRSINGDLNITTQRGWPAPGEKVSLDEALLPTVAAMIVNDLHELTEYLRYDGERIFDPHPGTDEDSMWNFLTDIANVTAKSMLDHHPRNERIA